MPVAINSEHGCNSNLHFSLPTQIPYYPLKKSNINFSTILGLSSIGKWPILFIIMHPKPINIDVL